MRSKNNNKNKNKSGGQLVYNSNNLVLTTNLITKTYNVSQFGAS